jgi:hypothetical protein
MNEEHKKALIWSFKSNTPVEVLRASLKNTVLSINLDARERMMNDEEGIKPKESPDKEVQISIDVPFVVIRAIDSARMYEAVELAKSKEDGFDDFSVDECIRYTYREAYLYRLIIDHINEIFDIAMVDPSAKMIVIKFDTKDQPPKTNIPSDAIEV